MKIITNEDIAPYDVDETLVLHGSPDAYPYATVEVKDPLNESRTISLVVHEPMIRLLKEEYARGAHIVVWSRGGYKWATNVVKALGLEKYVHQVMTKPHRYFDDKPAEFWMKDRVYIEPGTPYKNT